MRLKHEFQAKLNNSRIMGVDRMEKRIAGQAIDPASASGGIVRGSSAVTADHIVTGIARVRRIVDAELGMIKNVEHLGAKFQIALAENLEMFEQRHIEVCAARIVHGIAAAIAKGQTARSHKGARIGEHWTETIADVPWYVGAGISDAVGIGAGSEVVGDAAVVRHRDPAGTAAVDDAEGRASLKNGDSR